MLLNKMQHKDGNFIKIVVPAFEGYELIPADQVMRCEASDNYTYIYLKEKQDYGTP